MSGRAATEDSGGRKGAETDRLLMNSRASVEGTAK